jgi:hypothetical protein
MLYSGRSQSHYTTTYENDEFADEEDDSDDSERIVEFAQYQVQEMEEDSNEEDDDDEFSSLSTTENKPLPQRAFGNQDSSETSSQEGELERDIRKAKPYHRAKTAPMKPSLDIEDLKRSHSFLALESCAVSATQLI